MENSKRLVWSFSAKNDLQSIYDYYAQFSTKTANKLIDKIIEDVSVLEILGNERIGQYDNFNSNFRRIISGNYKIFYKVFAEFVLIVRVFNIKQDPIKSKRR